MLDGTAVFVFDLRTDVGERHDLSGQRQDIANRLVPLVTAWEKDVDAEGKPGDKPTTTPTR